MAWCNAGGILPGCSIQPPCDPGRHTPSPRQLKQHISTGGKMKESDYTHVQTLTAMRIAYRALSEVVCYNHELRPIMDDLRKQIEKSYAKLETTE